MARLDELNWNDVKVFLVAMRSKSLRDVAASLGVSHATAGRRLHAFEEGLGLTLFDRRADGLHPRPEAAVVATAAEGIERAMRAMDRVARAADPELRGKVRVTLPDAMAHEILVPELVVFRRRWPELDLHVLPSSEVSSLDRSEADVAVRLMPLGMSPAQHLVGRKAATAYRAIYGENTDAWIGWEGAPPGIGAIPARPYLDRPVRGSFPGPLLQLTACKAGLGLAWLPCFLGDGAVPRLSEPVAGTDIWVVVHPELRDSPRLRLFRDAIVEALKTQESRFEGRA